MNTSPNHLGKTMVKGWHAWLAIGLFVGAVYGIFLVASWNGEFSASEAAVGRNKPTQVQSSWTPYANNPIFKSNTSLLDGFPNDPWVIKDGGTYVMYYGATKGDFSDTNTVRIFRATSNDGINWQRNSVPILLPGLSGSWDSVKVETPSIIKLPDGTYRMYFAGSNIPDSEAGFQMGYATSPDGIVWTKYPGNPVLELGVTGSFDEVTIGEPSVLIKDGKYWMWYAGMSAGLKIAIDLAQSDDGIVWTKNGKVLELDVEREGRNEVGITEDHVIWNGSAFEIFYAVLQDGGQVLGPIWHATSSDGIAWVKDSGPILRRGSTNSWTGQGIASPSVLLEMTKYRMWYSGTHTDGRTFFELGIGVAEKTK